jgi:hypothetical protein
MDGREGAWEELVPEALQTFDMRDASARGILRNFRDAYKARAAEGLLTVPSEGLPLGRVEKRRKAERGPGLPRTPLKANLKLNWKDRK